ncbi:hypothetical protein HDU99_010706, partial [Rhizoclosmatium hyalinum]
YHQLCDWLYGWDVSNAAVETEGEDDAEEFSLKRVARDINLNEAGDKTECERILRTFETLFGISRRQLKRCYLTVE